MLPQFQITYSEFALPGDIAAEISMPPVPLEVLRKYQAELVEAGGQVYSEDQCYVPCPHCGSKACIGIGVRKGREDLLSYSLCVSCWYGTELIFVRHLGEHVR